LPEFIEAAKQQYDASRVGKSTFQV
jgi:hypothetical protein